MYSYKKSIVKKTFMIASLINGNEKDEFLWVKALRKKFLSCQRNQPHLKMNTILFFKNLINPKGEREPNQHSVKISVQTNLNLDNISVVGLEILLLGFVLARWTQ